MKRINKTILIIIMLILSFVGGTQVNKYIQKNNDKVTIIDTFTVSNGSWAVYNDSKGNYIFQPTETGDWDVTLNSKEELDNIIETYINIKNNGSY